LLNEFRTAKDADEKNTALRCLGCTTVKALRARTLAMPLSDEVKAQDFHLPLAELRHDAEGVEMTWAWFKDNLEAIKTKCPPALSLLGYVVTMATASFTRKEHIQAIEKFFEGKDRTGFEKKLEQSLDGVRAKSSWLERDGEDVKAWLKGEGLLKGEKL